MDAARWCFVLICQTPLTEGERGGKETGLSEEERGEEKEHLLITSPNTSG